MPQVSSPDDVDLSDVDDFDQLEPYLKRAVLLDDIQTEYGQIDTEQYCEAELYVMAWAIRRRRRLAAIAQARVMKKEHSLETPGTVREKPLSKRGLESAEAFKAFYAQCGIPVYEIT